MGDRDHPDDASAPLPSGLKDVLLVEDNFIIALDASDMLRELGVENVMTAVNQAEALAIMLQQIPQFALLDVNLGDEKGFEVAQQLRALGIPFAFGTGYADPGAFPAEFADALVVSKPYNLEGLARVLPGGRTKPGA